MESILKQITNSLEGNLKCKTIKSETISYEIDYEVKKEIRSKRFDFVIRDLEGEIVAIGDYIPKNSDVAGFQNLINGEASGISYPVFYVNEGGWFILVNGSSVDLDLDLEDWLYAEEFCPFLQSKHPSTKRDIDFYTEKLNKEIESLKGSLAEANLEIQKLKEDKELSLKLYLKKESELETFIFEIAANITEAQKYSIKRIIEEEEKLKKENEIPFGQKGWRPNSDLYMRKPFFRKTEGERIILGREIITRWSSDGFPTWDFSELAVIDKYGEILKKEDYTDEENSAGQSFGCLGWISCNDLIEGMNVG